MSQLKILKCISDKICELVDLQSAPQIRRDVEILCDVTDAENPRPVIVRYEYLTDGSSQTISATNLDGTAYTGIIADLRACEAEQMRYDVEERDFCVNNQSRVRIRVYDAESTTGTPVTEVWQDVLGNIVVAPVPADTVTLGACTPAVQYPYVYESCATVTATGEEIQVRVFELRDGVGAVTSRRIEDATGADVTSTVTIGGCETCCGSACIQFEGFDNAAPGIWQPGGTSAFEIRLDGSLLTTVVFDALVTFDGTNISTGYQPVIDYINNNVADWNISVASDVTSRKVLWQLEHSGGSASTLQIDRTSANNDRYVFSSDGAGNITATIDDGFGNDFSTAPVIQACS